MARVWTLREMMDAILENDVDSIKEICRRFPVTTVRLAKLSQDTQVVGFLDGIPDYVTVISIERQLAHDDSQKDPDEDGAEESPAKEEKDPAEHKREVDRKRQQRKRAKDKAAAEAEKEAKESDEAPAEEEETGKYDEIGAVELYKMCKARGLKAEARKPQRYYIDLLEADDQEKAKEVPDEPDDEDDGWGDDEEGAPAEENPKKDAAKSSRAKKSLAKKQEKEPEPADDDEDDWNI